MKKSRLIPLMACCFAAMLCVGCKKTPESSESSTGSTEIKIEDMGAGNSIITESSSEEQPIELATLDAPSAVYYDAATGVLSWNDNANASAGWSVKITQADTVCVETDVNTPSVSLTTLSIGTYTAELRTKEVENLFRASASVSYTFSISENMGGIVTEPMAQPSTFAYDAETDSLSWEDVEGNNGYALEIYDGENLVTEYNGTRAYASTLDLPIGHYTAKLVVLGDGKTTHDSQIKTLAFSISSWGDLNAPTNISIYNGMLVWDTVPHTNGVDIQLYDYATNKQVQATYVLENNNKLSIAELGVVEGNYKICLAWTSNRHNQNVSAYAEFGFSIEYAASYTPNDIVNFDGSLPKGEHGGARLVTENNVKYAAIYPTKDGWGRVAGPEFTLDFDRNPVVFISVGYVFGGYHLQIKQSDSHYLIVPDTNKLGNTSASIVEKTGVSGQHSVYIRLGVNGSTSTDANDALVHYSGIKVFYVNEITPGEIDAVENVQLNNMGEVVWDAPEHADVYDVCVKEYGTDNVLYEGETTATKFGVYGFDNGAYTVSITARNQAFGDLYTPSNVRSMDVRVSSAVRYSAMDLDTETGIFRTMGEQGIEAEYDESKGYTVFNSTNKEDWGYIGPIQGVTLNMDKNPLIVIKTEGVQGGFFAKQEFAGSSIVDVQKNTSLQYSGEGVHVIRANAKASAQNSDEATWSGVKEDYKFYMGSLGKADGSYKQVCRIYLTGIDIVYVEEYVEIPVPTVPTALSAPMGFTQNGTVITANSVEGNAVYTPVYDISLQGEGVSYTAQNVASPFVDMSKFDLVDGATYTFSVKAIGDGVYFADSAEATANIQYTVKTQVDFATADISRREGNGSIFTQETGNFTYKTTNGDWVLFAIAIALDSIGENDILQVELGEVTDGVMLAGRYYTDSNGAGYTYNLGGDLPVSSNDVRIYDMEKAELKDGVFYFGIGMGGGSGERAIEIKDIRVVTLEIAEA